MINIKLLRHWVPAAFCAFIVYEYVGQGGASTDNWKYISIWLTMCFFFVGSVTYSMHVQIRGLQAEIEQLKQLQQGST